MVCCIKLIQDILLVCSGMQMELKLLSLRLTTGIAWSARHVRCAKTKEMMNKSCFVIDVIVDGICTA